MGLLSKFFSKKELEALEALQEQFNSTQKKSQSDFICLVGISGKIKGLEILNAIEENGFYQSKDIKRLNAKLTEYYLRYKALPLLSEETENSLQYISYNFGEKKNFLIFPIEGNESFIITALTSNPSKILKDLLQFRIALYKLKMEKDENI